MALVQAPLVVVVLFARQCIYIILDLFNKNLCWLEGGNVMLRNLYSDVFLNVTSNLFSPLLDDERAETTDVNIFSISQRAFHFLKKGLQCYQHINFWHTSLL